MSLVIDNQQLHDQVKHAIQQSGLQAEVLTSQFSETTYISRVLFKTMAAIAGEQFRPQLYVFNRNNGKSAMRVHVGLFRLVCSNGLVMPAEQGSAHSLRIIHRDCKPTRQKLNTLPDLIVAGLDSISSYEESILELQNTKLTEDQAIQVIGNLNVHDNVKYRSIRNIVRPELTRPEDQGNTAWNVYNIVNENIRYQHGFNLTAFNQDVSLFSDVQTLSLDLVA